MRKKSKNYRSVIGVIAIFVIVVLLIIFLVPAINDNDITVYTGSGPLINMQSLTTGNAIAVPEVGHTAVYGFYTDNEKVGEITYTTDKEEEYNGINCFKITGFGEMTNTQSGISYEFISYVSKLDNSLVFSKYTYSTGGEEANWTAMVDRENNEIITEVMGNEVIYTLPDSYWEISGLHNNLTIGFEENMKMKSSTGGSVADLFLKLTIPLKEDVKTPLGLFEDCFKVQMELNQQEFTSTTSVWISDQGITPKMEVALSRGDIVSTVSTILIEYS